MKLTAEMCQEFFAEQSIDKQRIVAAVLMELNFAEDKFPEWPKDSVHGAAIVTEEAGELIRAALQVTYEKGQYYGMVKEAIQTAAMGIRFAINHPELERTKETNLD